MAEIDVGAIPKEQRGKVIKRKLSALRDGEVLTVTGEQSPDELRAHLDSKNPSRWDFQKQEGTDGSWILYIKRSKMRKPG